MTPRGGSTPDEIANSESLLGDFFDQVLAQFTSNRATACCWASRRAEA